MTGNVKQKKARQNDITLPGDCCPNCQFLNVCCVGLVTSCLRSSAMWFDKIPKFGGLMNLCIHMQNKL